MSADDVQRVAGDLFRDARPGRDGRRTGDRTVSAAQLKVQAGNSG